VRTADGVVAIAGDLFENDLAEESLWRSFTEPPETPEKNRQRTKQTLSHWDMFAVKSGGV
jgi:hypothetical protein